MVGSSVGVFVEMCSMQLDWCARRSVGECEEVKVEVVAVVLCHGHSSGIVAEDVCSTIVEEAGYDAAVVWEL